MNGSISKVLVVDDSRLARIALSKLLRKRDLNVDMAGTGAEALTYVREQCPDVVFMDYMMPDMDGFEATRQLHEEPTAAAVPVVMYTSQDTPEDRERAERLGVVGFLIKPSGEESLDRVLGEVREHIANSSPAAAAVAVDEGMETDVAIQGVATEPAGSASTVPIQSQPWPAGVDELEREAVPEQEPLLEEAELESALEADSSSMRQPEPQANHGPVPEPVDLNALRAEIPALAADAANIAVDTRFDEQLEMRVRGIVDPALAEVREVAIREAVAAVGDGAGGVDAEAIADQLARETTARVIGDIGTEASQRILDEATPAIERQLQEWMRSEAFTAQVLPQFLERATPPLRERLITSLREPLRQTLSGELTEVAREAGERAVDERGSAYADLVADQVRERVAAEVHPLRQFVYTATGVAAAAIVALAVIVML